MSALRSAALMLLALPVLAACDNPPPAPATPPSQPAAETPAAPPPPTSMMSAEPIAPAEPAAGAVSADAFAPVAGTWSADLANCGDPASVITIATDSFQGNENSCQISSLTEENGGFTAALSCQSGGQTANERLSLRPVFAPTGEGVELNWLDRGGEAVTVLRCPTAQTAAAQ